MGAHSVIDPPMQLDEITIFLPDIGEEERRLRNQIRVARMAANGRIVDLERGSQALQLTWLCIDTATEWMLRPADIATLEIVVDQCRRLLIVAQTAMELEAAL